VVETSRPTCDKSSFLVCSKNYVNCFLQHNETDNLGVDRSMVLFSVVLWAIAQMFIVVLVSDVSVFLV